MMALQTVLRAAKKIALKHGDSITNVATRWVLYQPAMAGGDCGRPAG